MSPRNRTLAAATLDSGNQLSDLSDVILDIGRCPQCWFSSSRVVLSTYNVTPSDIEHVTKQIGGFGSDNRAGLDGKLHRISAMRDRKDIISGSHK